MARIDVGSLGSLPSSLQGSLGDYIREQRRSAQWSLRQLADAAGVSNPYLSQIERGLRRPSAEILQQIAKALRISAETLYVRAGFLEEREGGHEVVTAVLADPVLTQRQKRVLLDIHASFRREALSEAAAGGAPAPAPETQPQSRPRPQSRPQTQTHPDPRHPEDP